MQTAPGAPSLASPEPGGISAAWLRAFIVFMVCFVTTPSFAQSISLPANGLYHPGKYTALRIDAPGPGLISIRGEEMLGIDFAAAGKTSVVVPLMCWRTTPGDATLTINGKSRTLALYPTLPTDPIPSTTTSSLPFSETASVGPTSAMYSTEAYIPASAWSRGRPDAVRKWIVVAAVVTALIMASAWLGFWRSRWLPVSIGIVAVVAMALALFRPELARRDTRLRVAVAADRQQDEWVYRSSRNEQAVIEPWTDVTWFVPYSRTHLKHVDPVLMIDAAGKPTGIRMQVKPGLVAATLHRSTVAAGSGGAPLVDTDDTASSPELVRRLYGTSMKEDGPWMRLNERPTARAATSATSPVSP